MLRARTRSRPSGKLATIAASTAGEAIAPPAPWTARAASSAADEVARLRKKSPYPLFRPEDTRELAVNYAGRASVLADPYAFPANGPLGGQPPMFILTAEFDMTRLSGQAYAAAVTEAGGAVTLVMEPGAPHGALARPSGEFGPRSLERIARWLLRKDQGG